MDATAASFEAMNLKTSSADVFTAEERAAFAEVSWGPIGLGTKRHVRAVGYEYVRVRLKLGLLRVESMHLSSSIGTSASLR